MDTNLTAALVALQNSMDRKVVELRGETGDRGLPGATGATGPAGKDAKFKIGVVVQGDKAEARIREGGDNTFILDLCLPVGPAGPRGFIGLTGANGVDGKNGTDGVDGKNGERGFTGANGQDSKVAGPKGDRGESGQSIKGDKGDPGDSINEEQLKAIFIKVLSEAGVLSIQSAKLVAVHAELRRAINKANSRHMGELADVYRKVDEIITGS